MKTFLLFILAMCSAAFSSAQSVRIYQRGVFDPGGNWNGVVNVAVFDSSSVRVADVLIPAYEFREIALPAGTYTAEFRTANYSSSYAIGNLGTHSFTLADREILNWSLVHDWSTQTPLVFAESSASAPSSTVNVLFLVLAAGFFFGWCLFSPLDV